MKTVLVCEDKGREDLSKMEGKAGYLHSMTGVANSFAWYTQRLKSLLRFRGMNQGCFRSEVWWFNQVNMSLTT